jgi:hypothetical protein
VEQLANRTLLSTGMSVPVNPPEVVLGPPITLQDPTSSAALLANLRNRVGSGASTGDRTSLPANTDLLLRGQAAPPGVPSSPLLQNPGTTFISWVKRLGDEQTPPERLPGLAPVDRIAWEDRLLLELRLSEIRKTVGVPVEPPAANSEPPRALAVAVPLPLVESNVPASVHEPASAALEAREESLGHHPERSSPSEVVAPADIASIQASLGVMTPGRQDPVGGMNHASPEPQTPNLLLRGAFDLALRMNEGRDLGVVLLESHRLPPGEVPWVTTQFVSLLGVVTPAQVDALPQARRTEPRASDGLPDPTPAVADALGSLAPQDAGMLNDFIPLNLQALNQGVEEILAQLAQLRPHTGPALPERNVPLWLVTTAAGSALALEVARRQFRLTSPEGVRIPLGDKSRSLWLTGFDPLPREPE